MGKYAQFKIRQLDTKNFFTIILPKNFNWKDLKTCFQNQFFRLAHMTREHHVNLAQPQSYWPSKTSTTTRRDLHAFTPSTSRRTWQSVLICCTWPLSTKTGRKTPKSPTILLRIQVRILKLSFTLLHQDILKSHSVYKLLFEPKNNLFYVFVWMIQKLLRDGCEWDLNSNKE